MTEGLQLPDLRLLFCLEPAEVVCFVGLQLRADSAGAAAFGAHAVIVGWQEQQGIRQKASSSSNFESSPSRGAGYVVGCAGGASVVAEMHACMHACMSRRPARPAARRAARLVAPQSVDAESFS